MSVDVFYLSIAYVQDCTVLLMQKIDNSTSMIDRSWTDFMTGFGNYWLSNDRIHWLTKDDSYKLRLELQARHETSGQLAWFWAEYTTFRFTGGC